MTRGRATKNEIEAIVNRPYTIEVIYGEAPDDGVLARVAEWPGCLTAGDTREEALSRIGDAMRDWVKARLERGLPIAEPMTEYGGEMWPPNFRILPQYVMSLDEGTAAFV